MLHKWDERLRTGDAVVDAQHRELFRLVEGLHDGIVRNDVGSVLEDVLDGLASYVGVHFAGEERLMRAARYPRYQEHKAIHDDLARQAREIIEGYRSGKLVLAVTLSQFLSRWIWNHIQENDLVMVKWVREHAGLSGPGPALPRP